ncbi:MAG: hypothetical protein R3199_09960 [Gemmatimonadota bacterium]|nr:hypothetical protein [Gemmatimonadota bacterium]
MGPRPAEPREPSGPPEEVPWQQKLFESPFLLLALGIGVVTVFYTLWGLYEILSLPPAPLP